MRLILDNLPITTYDLERGPESVRPGGPAPTLPTPSNIRGSPPVPGLAATGKLASSLAGSCSSAAAAWQLAAPAGARAGSVRWQSSRGWGGALPQGQGAGGPASCCLPRRRLPHTCAIEGESGCWGCVPLPIWGRLSKASRGMGRADEVGAGPAGFDLGFWADDRHYINNHLMFKILVYKTNGQYTKARTHYEELQAAAVVEVRSRPIHRTLLLY